MGWNSSGLFKIRGAPDWIQTAREREKVHFFIYFFFFSSISSSNRASGPWYLYGIDRLPTSDSRGVRLSLSRKCNESKQNYSLLPALERWWED